MCGSVVSVYLVCLRPCGYWIGALGKDGGEKGVSEEAEEELLSYFTLFPDSWLGLGKLSRTLCTVEFVFQAEI